MKFSDLNTADPLEVLFFLVGNLWTSGKCMMRDRLREGIRHRAIESWIFGISISLCALSLIVTAAEINLSKLPPPVIRGVDFVKDIQPILELSCLRCHNSAVSMSGFRLDNRAEALKGGERGVDIVSGQSGASPLIHFVARLVPGSQMPPQGQGDPLTHDEIGLLRAWIDQGAEWPTGLTLRPRPKDERTSSSGEAKAENKSALPPPVKHSVAFAREIRPILAKKCYSCHGPGQQNSQLRWDVKAIALKGGTSGPAILPGRSAESLMIRLVSGLQPGLVMPLKGEPLSSTEVGLLRAWIDQGASWPDGLDPKDYVAQSIHWSYRPLTRPLAPKTKGKAWARTPIDSFILAKLQEKNLRPSPPADKRTLLRRVTYDLIGLPPTPEEIQNFLADTSPDAYGRVVDRLLASPRYGEHWARHWLDVVHYADSHGHDQDRPRDNAWPYRDYVIRAFNEGKPYERFVEEQLAGDAFTLPTRTIVILTI